jgi:hypothetical protein
MAAPNIVNVTSITGLSTYYNITTNNTFFDVLTNSAGSNTVLKIGTILLTNTDGNNPVDVSVGLHNGVAGAATTVDIGKFVTVPARASIILIGKDSGFYLEEDNKIVASASNNDRASILVSYEVIEE